MAVEESDVENHHQGYPILFILFYFILDRLKEAAQKSDRVPGEDKVYSPYLFNVQTLAIKKRLWLLFEP